MDKPAPFKKVWHPAHRDFYLTMEHPKRGRMEHYIPQGFNSEAAAQAEADEMNRRCVEREQRRGLPHGSAGRVVVDFVDRPGAWVLEGFLPWPT